MYWVEFMLKQKSKLEYFYRVPSEKSKAISFTSLIINNIFVFLTGFWARFLLN